MIDYAGKAVADVLCKPLPSEEKRFEAIRSKYFPGRTAWDVVTSFADFVHSVAGQAGQGAERDAFDGVAPFLRAVKLARAGDVRWRNHVRQVIYRPRVDLMRALSELTAWASACAQRRAEEGR